MNNKKYIKCFSSEEKDILVERGFVFLFEQNDVFYFENKNNTTSNFSADDLVEKIRFTNSLNF